MPQLLALAVAVQCALWGTADGYSTGRRLVRSPRLEAAPSGEEVHFPPTQKLSRQRLADNAQPAAFAALPQTGLWKCSSKEQTARATSTMFTSVPVVQLQTGDGRRESLPYAEKAQMNGWPLLVRPPPGQPESTAKHLPQLVANLNEELDASDIGTYDPQCTTWAGIRDLKNDELESLKRVLGGKITPATLFQAMSEGRTLDVGGTTLPLGAKMTLQNFGLQVPSSDQRYLTSLKDGGFLHSWTSPVWPDDLEDYSTLFIHGKGHRTGAHIDDSAGGTYFYLKVVTGKKRVRIWPILDAEGLLAWKQAEQADGGQGVEFPFRGFLFNETLSGGLPSRWTERGFEWGVSPPDSAPLPDHLVSGPLQTAYSCYVEVEVNAGEELFVGSAVPHQVETVEPALAISKNYRFSNFAWMTRARMHLLAEAVGKVDPDFGTASADEVLTFDNKESSQWGLGAFGDSSVENRLRDLWRQGVRPLTRTNFDPPSDAEELVRDVMMAWADPSIAVNRALIHKLVEDSRKLAWPLRFVVEVLSSYGGRLLLSGVGILVAVSLLISHLTSKRKSRGKQDGRLAGAKLR